jgi:hypothetical protein
MTTRYNQATISAHFEQVFTRDTQALPYADWTYFRPIENLPRPLVLGSAMLYKDAAVRQPINPHYVSALNAYTATIADTTEPTVVQLPPSVPFNIWPTDSCAQAEPCFNIARKQMFGPVNQFSEHGIVSVYHDEFHRPVMLRKKLNTSSALALVAMRLDGSNLDVPAGTIISLGSSKDAEVTGEKTVINPQDGLPVTTLRSIVFDPQKEYVRPMRHSAWVYPNPLDRALFATYGERATISKQDRLDMVTDYSLEHYRELAEQLLQLCLSDGPASIKAPALADRAPLF